MSWSHAGPTAVTSSASLDSPDGTISGAEFDALDLEFDYSCDTEWANSWVYFPNDFAVTGQLLRLRLQNGGGSLYITLDQRDASYSESNVFGPVTVPYTTGETARIRITRTAARLVVVHVGGSPAGSGTHSVTVAVVDGMAHFGNTSPGSITTIANVLLNAAAGGPALSESADAQAGWSATVVGAPAGPTEDVVVNFYSSTPAAITDKTFNQANSGLTAGVLFADLAGYDSGAASGISFTLGSGRTPDTNGRSAGANALAQQINAQMAYHTGAGPMTDTFTLPEGVVSCDVIVHLCTSYTGQDDIDVTVNGSTQSGFDSSGNTTGAVLTFVGVEPDVNGDIDITIQNVSVGAAYLAINGYRLTDIQYASAPESAAITQPGDAGSEFDGSAVVVSDWSADGYAVAGLSGAALVVVGLDESVQAESSPTAGGAVIAEISAEAIGSESTAAIANINAAISNGLIAGEAWATNALATAALAASGVAYNEMAASSSATLSRATVDNTPAANLFVSSAVALANLLTNGDASAALVAALLTTVGLSASVDADATFGADTGSGFSVSIEAPGLPAMVAESVAIASAELLAVSPSALALGVVSSVSVSWVSSATAGADFSAILRPAAAYLRASLHLRTLLSVSLRINPQS